MDNRTANETLAGVLEMNTKLKRDAIKTVLILFKDNLFILGDNCIILYNLGQFKNFFKSEVRLDINIVTDTHIEKYESICKNNPNFDQLFFEQLGDIKYDNYDLVICISEDETQIIQAIHAKYADKETALPDCAIYSYSKIVFKRRDTMKEPVFPLYEDFLNHYDFQNKRPYELYLSPEEKRWGDNWLEANGIKNGEDLFIVVDSASDRSKVLGLATYYDVVLNLLGKSNARILIFDEENVGKDMFYRQLFGDDNFKKFIFSRGLELRRDLCLIGSSYTKMVFGPCTGLLHCASGIYNNFVRNNIANSEVPIIITYTGPWDAQFWWGNSPLVNCLVIRKVAGKNEIADLRELSQFEQQSRTNRLHCSEYTSDMIINYIDRKLNCEERKYSEKVTNEKISKVWKTEMQTIDRVNKKFTEEDFRQ